MKVFKFGGASVKDAEGVRNVLKVLNEVGFKDTVIVVSAMGKTTNALEEVVDCYFNRKSELQESLQELVKFHIDILLELLEDQKHAVFVRVKELFDELKGFLAWNKSPKYNFVYDQVVCYGELISSTIVSEYLKTHGIANSWIDIREVIKTDAKNRDAQVNWEHTQQQVNKELSGKNLVVTQGFIGSDENNFSTTLGREGSDYTAAILAYCLNAESVTIWKDVPGILNADPRYFEHPKLLKRISYREAIELAFYGATVIHPKTLQPLQRKEIPLYVKSFMQPLSEGTAVGKGEKMEPSIPCFILKKGQALISLSSLDFSFIMEENISEIFKLLNHHQLKVDLIQNSAISFSVCVDNRFKGLDDLLQTLKAKFKVTYHENVSLFTIRHFNEEALQALKKDVKEILLEQRSKETAQFITR